MRGNQAGTQPGQNPSGLRAVARPYGARAALAALILSIAPAAHAQWQLQSPIPTDRNVYGVSFVTPAHGFLVGTNRSLFETTDSGASWAKIMQSDFGSDPFYEVLFPDAVHGYLTGNNNDCWRTTNGGGSWERMTTMPAGSWSHLDFMTGTTGFAGANGACVFTTNAGATWSLRSGYPDCPVIYGMDFRDTQVGLVGGYLPSAGQNGIWKTTNGGVSWTRKHTQSPNDILYLSQSTAVAAIGTGFYRSTNDGETWSQIAGGISTGLSEIAHAGASLLVGVSGKGDIWRSEDNGSSWSFVFDGLGDLPDFWTVSLLSETEGWVAGHHGIILHTTDGGVTWSLMNSGSAVQIYDLGMAGGSFSLAACQNGYVLRTTNGGGFWETQKLEVTGQIFGREESLHGVSVVDQNFAVTAGPGGTVFRTLNGGVDWQSVGYPQLPDPFWIEDVEFVDHDLGWLVGLDQDLGHDKTVYRTTNGGTTWELNLRQASYFYAVDFVDAQHGVIATIDRAFFRTTNGGQTWMSGLLPDYFTDSSISDMEFANAQVGWAVGWYGYVAKTTNGGASWSLQDLGTADDDLFDLDVVSPTEAWTIGREEGSFRGFVRHTTNGGTTWEKQVIDSNPYLPVTVSATQAGSVWTGGYNGRIWHHPGDIAGAPERAPAGGFGSVAAFPDPFAGRTDLHFSVPEAGRALIGVFDVQGRQVATLVDRFVQAGPHVATWDAGDLPAGTYFLRLEQAPGMGGSRARGTGTLHLIR